MSNLSELTGTYAIDAAHSSLSFVARHAMVAKVRGSFEKFEGTANLDGQNPDNSSVRVTIDPASVDTRSSDRDAHLASPDFFDVAQHPSWHFESTGVKVTGDDTFDVAGNLTIKGVTQPVTIPFEYTGSATDPFGNQRAGFEGEITVNRKDFGLTWNAALETGGVLVSEKVKLELEISAIKQA
ncbi:YceI family protein [Enemella evansiae]|uniref:Polyisoprenoid-binding protein n=1 Tax=Enemella evansiae TaxID=2016499 RepID=A0A255GJZ2_9ACTN|nr:YceI family protein [Enemella evansiae]PFG65863.1 polyisoprenoid-binding protein YceI [Propionibacteriaceae bacterium ES.041]OYN98679.1 polyisoprenoid-binding protein [Enemella evansiae]OYN98830.1 polyisoprenoid-binding protein [Enemella evansiae]OYO03279.1 polyisoprenoid-binding protein [Enemella evansiae]OYO13907.1 polyisoprenoid-binding protein [Enemella evansiae]